MEKLDKYQWYNYLNSKPTHELLYLLVIFEGSPVDESDIIRKIRIVLEDRGK